MITFLLVLSSFSFAFSGDMYVGSDLEASSPIAQLDEQPPGGPPPEGPPPFERRRGEGPFRKGMNMEDMKRFDTLQLMKLLELLDLSEERENQFIVMFRKHKKEQREYMHKRDSLIETMANVLRQDNKSNDQILKVVEDLNRLDSTNFGRMKSFFEETKSILTVEQLAKLYVFQARFGPEVFNKLREFRGHRKGQPGKFDNDSSFKGR